MFRNIKLLLFIGIVYNVLLMQKALAYLDPGTGSMVIQIIIAIICSCICTAKIWFNKILNIFKREKNDDK